VEWEKLGFIKASSHRQQILASLNVRPLTPKELSKNLDIHLSQVTRNLREMEQRELVYCLTPNLRKGRIYRISEEGKKLLSQLTIREKK
jgi:predicted transcriptional regulator